MKFSTKDFFSKSFLRIWSHLLKKSLMENFIFCAVYNVELYRGFSLPKTDMTQDLKWILKHINGKCENVMGILPWLRSEKGG